LKEAEVDVKAAKEKEAVNSKVCVICEEKECNTAVLFCGHMSFCEECALPLKICPICRTEVAKTQRIYMH